jgi:hypothetical protein
VRTWFAILLLTVSTAFAGEVSVENTAPPIDTEMVERIWHYIKQATHAPQSLPPPRIVMDWEVPPLARMGYQFPTLQFPDNASQISIAPRTVDMWPRDIVSWGIGHELTHYVFLMRENNWNPNLRVFVNKRRHHCDPEFQEITRGIADLIWATYHSSSDRTKMYDEVQKSCFLYPDQ